MPLVQIKEADRRFYEERIRDFLPEAIIDIHTHVWRAEDMPEEPDPRENRNVSWPSRVAPENPIEDLLETYRLLLPGKRVTPLIFPTLPRRNTETLNRYVQQCSAKNDVPALLFSEPAWSPAQLERKILEGRFLGAKSYLSLAPAYLPTGEIRIFDFFPPHQLAVLDRHGWIAMLHIPRNLRLRDPVNLAQMLEIEKRYPNLKLIAAHVGRAYCRSDVGDAFEVLADTKNLCFDISANTNEWVFRRLIRSVGSKRILYGTDLPVERMRMRRIEREGRYINRVPRGLYGDVSGDIHMEEVIGREAEKLTFFLYEEIDAFRRASEKTRLTESDIEDVFYNNANRLIESAKRGG
jgi:hypothetical protein